MMIHGAVIHFRLITALDLGNGINKKNIHIEYLAIIASVSSFKSTLGHRLYLFSGHFHLWTSPSVNLVKVSNYIYEI